MKTDVISDFRDEYAFLSNFYRAPFVWRGITFETIEHSFQYSKVYSMTGKLPDMTAYEEEVLSAATPGLAKKLGRAVDIDLEHWELVKVSRMREMVHAKFGQVPGLAGKLINTGASLLVEGNTWGDTFWGRCNGKGLNVLGSILMEERGYWLYCNGDNNAL